MTAPLIRCEGDLSHSFLFTVVNEQLNFLALVDLDILCELIQVFEGYLASPYHKVLVGLQTSLMSGSVQIHVLHCENVQMRIGVALYADDSPENDVVGAPIPMQPHLYHTRLLLDDIVHRQYDVFSLV